MKKTELIAGGIALLALTLKFFHLEGGNILFIVSFLFLAFLYFYLGFALFNNIPFRKIFKKESYKGISTLRIIGAFVAGSFLSQTLIGILFNVLKWEGGVPLLRIGLIGLAIVLIVGLVRYIPSKASFYLNVFGRVALFGGLGLIMLLP